MIDNWKEKKEIALLTCLRAAVMAAIDIKCEHEEVKAKFGVGPFQTIKWQSSL